MTPQEIKADIFKWQERLVGLGLRAFSRYSQADRSAYIEIPLKLPSAAYPPELLPDLESIGIRLLGSFNATMDGEPATMGFAGSEVVSTDTNSAPTVPPTVPSPVVVTQDQGSSSTTTTTGSFTTYSSTYSSASTSSYSNLISSLSYLNGGALSQKINKPTSIVVMLTVSWVLTPAEYRGAFPEDTSIGASPAYTNL